MIGSLEFFLRLTLWCLLTAEASWVNLLIGALVACLLPSMLPRRLNDSRLDDLVPESAPEGAPEGAPRRFSESGWISSSTRLGLRARVWSALREFGRALGKIVLAIPQAYAEAFEILFFPHTETEICTQVATDKRSPGLAFLDIFLITFTPKTIVLKHEADGPGPDRYIIHRLHRWREPWTPS